MKCILWLGRWVNTPFRSPVCVCQGIRSKSNSIALCYGWADQIYRPVHSTSHIWNFNCSHLNRTTFGQCLYLHKCIKSLFEFKSNKYSLVGLVNSKPFSWAILSFKEHVMGILDGIAWSKFDTFHSFAYLPLFWQSWASLQHETYSTIT